MSDKTELFDSALEILKNDNGFINLEGYSYEEVASGVRKYVIEKSGIKHLLVYIKDNEISEVSVYCGKGVLSISSARSLFENERYGYNFRENYTQYLFDTRFQQFPFIAFIHDNEIILENGRYYEKTPRGKREKLNELLFDGFVLRKK